MWWDPTDQPSYSFGRVSCSWWCSRRLQLGPPVGVSMNPQSDPTFGCRSWPPTSTSKLPCSTSYPPPWSRWSTSGSTSWTPTRITTAPPWSSGPTSRYNSPSTHHHSNRSPSTYLWSTRPARYQVSSRSRRSPTSIHRTTPTRMITWIGWSSNS